LKDEEEISEEYIERESGSNESIKDFIEDYNEDDYEDN
jgi:hypothetical protein